MLAEHLLFSVNFPFHMASLLLTPKLETVDDGRKARQDCAYLNELIRTDAEFLLTTVYLQHEPH